MNEIELRAKIHEIGIDKIRFYVPMHPVEHFMGVCAFTSSNTPEYFTECYINEERYKVDDEYKITLHACDPRFSYEHYYQCDLASLITSERIYIKEDGEYLEGLWYAIPITKNVFLHSFAT
jgi:hypothetical protein